MKYAEEMAERLRKETGRDVIILGPEELAQIDAIAEETLRQIIPHPLSLALMNYSTDENGSRANDV